MLSEERPRNTSLAVGQKIGEREILFFEDRRPARHAGVRVERTRVREPVRRTNDRKSSK